MGRASRKSGTIVAEDGRELSATWWIGEAAEQKSLIVLTGLAVPQFAAHSMAKFLATQGWGVLTFDYRGVAKSHQGPSDEAISLDDWIEKDLPAVERAVREKWKPQFLGVIAHSIGGQLLGQSEMATRVDGMVLVAAQRGIPKLFHGRGWWSVRYAYSAFPLLIKLLGRLPVSRYTFPVACPSTAVLQWVRWGRRALFSNQRGESTEHLFQRVRAPVKSVVFSDDPYAPEAAVAALLELFSSSDSDLVTLSPEQFEVETIGHFGLFGRRAPQALWRQINDWLLDMALSQSQPEGD